MSTGVYANGNEIACKAGDGKVIAAFPDVCMSPPSPPAGPIPVPYPNTSFSKDMQEGSKTVKIKDKEVMLKDQSFYKTSPLGNEAATNSFGAGVVSHVTAGKTYFTCWSMDVKFEGQNVDRHIDLTTSNHASQPGNSAPGPSTSTMSPPGPVCPPHAWQRIPESNTVEDRIKTLESSKNVGDPYNACVARKYLSQGKQVDVSLRFKCFCGAYQEIDLLVDGKPMDTKAGTEGAGKRQTLNYKDISTVLFDGTVTMVFETAAVALKEAPHIEKWGAEAIHEPC